MIVIKKKVVLHMCVPEVKKLKFFQNMYFDIRFDLPKTPFQS